MMSSRRRHHCVQVSVSGQCFRLLSLTLTTSCLTAPPVGHHCTCSSSFISNVFICISHSTLLQWVPYVPRMHCSVASMCMTVCGDVTDVDLMCLHSGGCHFLFGAPVELWVGFVSGVLLISPVCNMRGRCFERCPCRTLT